MDGAASLLGSTAPSAAFPRSAEREEVEQEVEREVEREEEVERLVLLPACRRRWMAGGSVFMGLSCTFRKKTPETQTLTLTADSGSVTLTLTADSGSVSGH